MDGFLDVLEDALVDGLGAVGFIFGGALGSIGGYDGRHSDALPCGDLACVLSTERVKPP